MKNQLTSLLLCALLCSTLGHEYLARRQLSEHAKSLGAHDHQNERHLLSQFKDVGNNCNITCSPVVISGGLEFYIHAEVNLVAIFNATANVAVVIDLNLGLVATFNGSSGATVIINIQTKEGYYIKQESWNSHNQSFEVFFESLTSLQVTWNLGLKVGTKFTVGSASSIILNIVLVILVSLKVNVSGGASQSLNILLDISSTLVVVFKGSLNGILKGLGKLKIEINGSLQWLARTLKGLGDVLGSISGGLSGLIQKGVVIRLDVLLTLRSGIEILVYLLIQIRVKLDVSVVFGDNLSSPEKLIDLIVALGGKELVGINGVYIVLQKIIAYINKSIQLNELIEILIYYTITVKDDGSLKAQFNNSLDSILVLLRQINSSSYQVVIAFFVSLREGHCIYKGVNVSAILDLILTVSGRGALVVVISVLLSLQVIVAPAIALATLFFVILNVIVISNGVAIIVIFTGIQGAFIAAGNIVTWIIQQLNPIKITQIITLIISGQIEKSISLIPFIGEIWAAFAAGIRVSSNGSISISIIFSAGGQIVQQIGGFITNILKGSVQVGGSTSVSASYGFSISA